MIAYPTIMVMFTQFYLGPPAYWARHFQVFGCTMVHRPPGPQPNPSHRGTDAQFVQGVASPRVHLLRFINGCHRIDAFLAEMGMTWDDRVPHGNNGSAMVQETKNWINSSENLMGHGITRECLGSLSGSLSANLSHQQPLYKSPMTANLTVIIYYWRFLLAGLVESPRYLAPKTSY